MSKYPKAKMPDYGDGPEPCVDCAIKDKRIAELEAKIEEFIYIESHGEDILSEGGADEHKHGDNGVEIPRPDGGTDE